MRCLEKAAKLLLALFAESIGGGLSWKWMETGIKKIKETEEYYISLMANKTSER